MTQSSELKHYSVLLAEVLEFLPSSSSGTLLDVTAGGGGHFFAILRQKPGWRGECWDRDPAACERINAASQDFAGRYTFVQKNFSEAPAPSSAPFDYILADLGISSFQLDDPNRGLSFYSSAQLDFRMNPEQGESFVDWLKGKSSKELEEILVKYGEELRAKKIALKLKEIDPSVHKSSKAFSEELMRLLHMRVKKNEAHPLTRVFQALRIAINGELSELEALLNWAPAALAPGGRLAIISFHSLEDRKVKRAFMALEQKGFRILTDKALTPTEKEVHENTRSRSAKLRVLERMSD
ncbi:MAG: 16S rRNA (cytosine(1402)-N(4))-methyltransferase RsmH [Bdellovibrionota bacterium]